MVCEDVFRIIEDFKPIIRKTLEDKSEIILELFELRNDEIDFLKEDYSKEFSVEIRYGFGAPGNSFLCKYAIIGKSVNR